MAVSRTFPLGARPPFLAGRERRAQAAESSGRPTKQRRTRPLRALGAPTITGTPTIGEVLTSTTFGSWSGDLPISFARQWLRDGVPISGATSDSILLSVVDFGANITCRITATNPLGSVAVESNALGPIAAVLPDNVVAPVVSGTPTEDETLSCTTGSWSGTTPITFSFQWRRDGSPIGGATSTTYVLQAADVGAMVDCVVTASNVGGTADQDSNDVGPIAASGGGVSPTITVAPALTWTVAHGSSPTITEGTYTGDAGTWTYDLVRLPSTTVLSGVSKATVEAYVADRATDVGPSWKVTGTITNGSGSDSADSNVMAWDPIATLSPVRWLEADAADVTVDGSDDVTEWADRSANSVPMEGPAGPIPTYVATDANLNNQGSIDFAASASEMLRESGVDSDLKCLHDGTGGTFIAVVDTDGAGTQQSLYSTSNNFTASSTGFFVRYTGSGWRAALMRSASPFVADRTGAITGGEKGVLVIRMGTGESLEFEMRWNGTQIASDPTFDATPSSSDPADVARIGTNSSGAQAFDGRVAAIGVVPTYLDGDALLDLERYCEWKWGL